MLPKSSVPPKADNRARGEVALDEEVFQHLQDDAPDAEFGVVRATGYRQVKVYLAAPVLEESTARRTGDWSPGRFQPCHQKVNWSMNTLSRTSGFLFYLYFSQGRVSLVHVYPR